MVEHKEVKKQITASQKNVANAIHTPKETNHVQPLGYIREMRGETQEDVRNCSFGYAMWQRDVSTVQQEPADTKGGVVQRAMEPNELLDAVLRHVPERAGALRGELELIDREGEPGKVVKEIKAALNRDQILTHDELKIIYNTFFDFYGIKVKQQNQNGIRQIMNLQGGDEIDLDRVFVQDQRDLADELSDLYGTKTGKELLDRIATRGDEGVPGPTIYMGYAMQAPYTNVLDWDKSKDVLLSGNRQQGYECGKGTDSFIVLNSKTLDWQMKRRGGDGGQLKEDPRIILAHELIHALHAQMGVKPTWKMLVDAQYQTASADMEQWLDERFQEEETDEYNRDIFIRSHLELNGAHEDDVPTTGIIEDIWYPEPLQVVAHINENQIRKELGLEPRKQYILNNDQKW
ncbi:MAG: hypothetical protein K2K87_14595 [Lachnospiraceae bacterium]|nr:hypothetical protein [Lachnospiraceae bacterium]